MAADDVTARGGRPSRRPGSPLWPRRGEHPVRATLIGAVLAGYAWVAGATTPFTADSLISVLIPGVVVAALASAWPPERVAPPQKLDVTGMSYWLICLAALFEWEASAFRDNSLPWHPSLTLLINPLLGPHVVKSGAILIWMLAGWALVRR